MLHARACVLPDVDCHAMQSQLQLQAPEMASYENEEKCCVLSMNNHSSIANFWRIPKTKKKNVWVAQKMTGSVGNRNQNKASLYFIDKFSVSALGQV